MEKLYKSILIVGLNDKDEHAQIIDTARALDIIRDCTCAIYDGATISECNGLYKGEFEQSFKLEILYSDATRDALLAEYLKKALNQECIYYERAEVAAAFI